MSIRFKFIAVFVFIISVTGGIIGTFTHLNWASDLERNTVDRTIQTLKSKRDLSESYFLESNRIFQTTWFNPIVQSYINDSGERDLLAYNQIRDLLSSKLYLNPYYEAIILFNQNERPIYATKGIPIRDTEILNLPYDLPNDTLPHVIPPHNQPYFVKGENVTSVIRGIALAGRSNPDFYLVMDVNTNYIQKTLEVQSKDSGYFFVADENGAYIYHPDTNLVGTNLTHFKNHDTNKSSGSFYNRIGNSNILITYVKGDLSGWTYYSAIPYAELNKGIIQNRNYSILITGICVIAAILIISILVYGITKPFADLRIMMAEVEKGDFSSQLHVKRQDEVGMLIRRFNRMVKELDYMTKEVYISKIIQKEAQLRQLQAQINPHFLYNTMDNIYAMATIDGNKSISSMVSNLSKLLRYNLHDTDRLTTVHEEIEHVSVYLKIQETRFNDRIRTNIHVEEEIEDCPIIRFTLQPLVENAVSHGLEPKKEKGNLWLTVKKDQASLIIRITDDGVGIKREKLEKVINNIKEVDKNNWQYPTQKHHIGLSNVHQRLRLFYGEKYDLKIESTEGKGTSLELRIPILYQKVDY
ncbi:sensor histidine kinase [Radiobacillus sp. PE A8.2]|uniref:sensor histidine kinase n=1 Tax=Radiobacillus sp. PE A8.2 TaxID=3380349 RepID=UPI00388F0925